MKDIEFGLLAQMAYYNWHNYDYNEKNLYRIFNDKTGMAILTQGKSEGFIKNNMATIKTVTRKNGETVSYNVYNEEDKRLLMVYSEDELDPDKNSKYKSLFKDWELVEGTDHEKIKKEPNFLLDRHSKRGNFIKNTSVFQASDPNNIIYT